MADDKKPPELTAIIGAKTRNELLAAMRNIRENLAVILEYQRYDAQITRRKYLALLDEGFTEAQAIELCKK